MGLDDFSNGSKGTSRGGGGGRRRTNKLDFSQPYIRIIRKMDEQIAADVAVSRVLKPGDDPENDYEVLTSFSDRMAWKNFRAKLDRKMGLDADEILEKNPEQIPELRSEITKPDPRSPTRECVVCGCDLVPGHKPFRELRIARDRKAYKGVDKIPVCEDHTIAELLEANTDGEN